jgi:hypothetical protein
MRLIDRENPDLFGVRFHRLQRELRDGDAYAIWDGSSNRLTLTADDPRLEPHDFMEVTVGDRFRMGATVVRVARYADSAEGEPRQQWCELLVSTRKPGPGQPDFDPTKPPWGSGEVVDGDASPA